VNRAGDTHSTTQTTRQGSGIAFRPLRQGDEKGLIALYERVFDARRSAAFWRWRYVECPQRPILIAVGESKGTIVAHLALAAREMSVDGHSVLAFQACEAMVDPTIQNRQVMFALRKELRQLSRRTALNSAPEVPWFAYAITRKDRVSAIDDLGSPSRRYLTPLDELVAYEPNMQRVPWTREESSYRFEESSASLSGFTPEDEAVWNVMSKTLGWTTRRTRLYMNWRYSTTPGIDYRVVRLYRRGDLWGLVVLHPGWRELSTAGRPVLAIVDCVCADWRAADLLMRRVETLARDYGLPAHIWTTKGHRLADVMSSLGWSQRSTGYVLTGVMSRSSSASSIHGFWDNPFHMIGDSEAYGEA
jgi:Acetyltransferase (GNAT) domain